MPEVIFRYARRMAIADAVLIDATQGDFAVVPREHLPDRHFAMTSAVFALIERAVESADGSEFAGIWHEILWMSRVRPVRLLRGGHTLKSSVCANAQLGRHGFKILFRGSDCGEVCAASCCAMETERNCCRCSGESRRTFLSVR